MVNIRVQGHFDYPTPAPPQSCRPTRETFFVIADVERQFPSISPFRVSVPLAEFATVEDARACADAIQAAIAMGQHPSVLK